MSTPPFFGSEFRVNTTTADDQQRASVTALADGRFVTVWQDSSETSGDTDLNAIRGQVFNADGTKAGVEFLVNQATAGAQNSPVVTALSDGHFVVAWQDESHVGGDAEGFGIKARIFNVDGSPAGSEFLVNNSTGNSQSDPAIAALKDGSFVVTWTTEFSATDLDVRARGFNADGTPRGGDFGIDFSNGPDETQSAVIGLANDKFAVVWVDEGSSSDETDGSGTHIRGAIYDSAGRLINSEFVVNTRTFDDQFDPAIALLSNGNFIVTWTTDFGNGDLDIRARVFNPSGIPIGDDFVIDANSSEDEVASSVTPLGDGSSVVAWTNFQPVGPTNFTADVKGQLFTGTAGSDISEEFTVNTTTQGNQRAPSLTTLSDGRVVAIWTDFLSTPDDPGGSVRGQIFDPRTHAVSLTGTALNDDWVGTSFDDAMNGGAGSDRIAGGAGADFLDGGAGNDRLDGGAGNDSLSGGAGGDVMIGGSGDDLYFVDDAGDVIIENADGGTDTVVASISHTLANDVENLSLNDEVGNATDGIGNALANTITGNDFANLIDGGLGADAMAGGLGDDTYVVDNAGDIVDESLFGSNGIDLVRSAIDFSLADAAHVKGRVENLALIGSASINGTGNALGNIITGNSGANVIDGGAGADVMAGGLGDDTYIVDEATDTVIEEGDGGTDTILSAVNFVLGDNVETLILTGPANINGVGNALANSLTGNALSNLLDGGRGSDVLRGEGGLDTIIGSKGKDILVGGLGNDLLTGGKNKDQFLFDATLDAIANVDTVVKFKAGKDLIGLDQDIFASLKLGDLKGKAFFEGKKAHDKNDHVIYNDKTGELFYDADGKGGAAAVKFAILDKKLDLSADDFLVV